LCARARRCITHPRDAGRLGQDDTAIGWDPRTDHYSDFFEYAQIAVGIILCYGHWKCLSWIVKTFGQRAGSVGVRGLWPSAMLVVSAISYVGVRADWTPLAAVGLVALPVLVPVMLSVQVVGLIGWRARVLGSTGIWFGSYALVRVAEWHRELNGPPSRRIT